MNVSCLISNIWIVHNSDWYINNESSFHSIYNCNVFMIFLLLSESEISENVKDNFIIYMRIETIKLQIDDQMLTTQNVCYSENLTHNLIFYESLKWQRFKIENIEENKLDIFKITDFQEQIFKVFLSEINIYSFLNSISSISLILLTVSAKKQVDFNKLKINYKNAEIMKM